MSILIPARFDSTKNGFLTEHDFVYGWIEEAAKCSSNDKLCRIKELTQGDNFCF